MKRAFAAILMLGACSNLPSEGDGVVALELRSPLAVTLREGESITLQARALDRAGQPIDAAIRWRTADSTISVDSLLGLVTAILPSGTGRVQAVAGTLRSDFITFTLQPQTTGGVRQD